MEHNPYAPPTASATTPLARGFVFSSEGVEVVTGLAKWMRALSTFFYVALALMVVGTCAVVFGGGIGEAIIFLVAVALMAMAATWLRSAASGFERGVLGDDEMTLGQGFRSLRAYLMLFGIFSILSLGINIFQGLAAL